MAQISQGILTSTIPNLCEEPGIREGIRGWLSSSIFQLHSWDGSLLKLDRFDGALFRKYLAFDYERFALSSAESYTYCTAEYSSSGVIGWPILKLYYSAFFAAHAIMRGLGQGIVKLERQQTDLLNGIIQITLGTAATLQPGMYHFELEVNQLGQPSLSMQAHREASGVHDGFWRAFSTCLDDLADKIVSRSLPDAGDFVGGLSELRPYLSPSTHGRGAWISAIRNQVNYQHAYDVWFPRKKQEAIAKKLNAVKKSSSEAVRLDLALSPDPIPALISASEFLSNLNFEQADFLARRSTKARSFGQKWRQFNELCAAA